MPGLLYEAQADLLQVLGHPVRIHVLEVLQRAPVPVRELLAAIEMEVELPELSQQLAVLLGSGVVAVNRRGTTAVYEVAVGDVDELLTVARRMSSALLSSQGVLLEQARERASEDAS